MSTFVSAFKLEKGMFTPPPHTAAKKLFTLESENFNKESCTIQKIDVSEWEGKDKYVVRIDGILSAEEAHAMITFTEEKRGYEVVKLNVGNGKEILCPEVRKGYRAVVDDKMLADELWRRISTVLSNDTQLHEASFNGKLGLKAVGLNERLRFLRYNPGDYFLPHNDGAYQRDDPSNLRYGERSYVTMQLYLNEGFEGGATRLLARDKSMGYDVVPKTGSVLLFQHDTYHEGSLVVTGQKYAMRTDVMYTS